MHISNILFISLLGVTSAAVLQQPQDDQCHIVTETSQGPGFWVPTPDAKVTPQADVTGGRYDDILGQSKPQNSGKPSDGWLGAAPDASESGWGQWLSNIIGSGSKTSITSIESFTFPYDPTDRGSLTFKTTESSYTVTDGSGNGVTSVIIGEHTETSRTTYVETTSAVEDTTTPKVDHTGVTKPTTDLGITTQSSSSYTSPVSATTSTSGSSSTVLSDTPFAIVVKGISAKLSRRSIAYVHFSASEDPSTATVTDDASIAFIGRRDNAGKITAWDDASKTLTGELGANPARMQLCSSCGPGAGGWTIGGNLLSFPGASFCLKQDGLVYMNFGSSITDCNAVNLVITTACAGCPAPLGSPSSTNAGTSASSAGVATSSATTNVSSTGSGNVGTTPSSTSEVGSNISTPASTTESTSTVATNDKSSEVAGTETSGTTSKLSTVDSVSATTTGFGKSVIDSTDSVSGPTISSSATSSATASVDESSSSIVSATDKTAGSVTSSTSTSPTASNAESKSTTDTTSSGAPSIGSETISAFKSTTTTDTSAIIDGQSTPSSSVVLSGASTEESTKVASEDNTSSSTTISTPVKEDQTSAATTSSNSEDPKETPQLKSTTTSGDLSTSSTTTVIVSITSKTVTSSTDEGSVSTTNSDETKTTAPVDTSDTATTKLEPTITSSEDTSTTSTASSSDYLTSVLSSKDEVMKAESVDITSSIKTTADAGTTSSSEDKTTASTSPEKPAVTTTSVEETSSTTSPVVEPETTMTSIAQTGSTTTSENPMITTSSTKSLETTSSTEEPGTTTLSPDDDVTTTSTTGSPESTPSAEDTTQTTSSADTITTTSTANEEQTTGTISDDSVFTQTGESLDDDPVVTSTSPAEDAVTMTSTTDNSETTMSSSNDEITTTASSPDDTITSTPYPTLNVTDTGILSNSSTNSSTSTTPYAPEQTFELDGPIDLGSVPPTVLDAVSPPDIDMGSLDRFEPVDTSKLWFNGPDAGGDGENGAVTVRVAVDYENPSIVLDQSIYIKDITCSSGSILGRINNADAYAKAQASWVNHPLIFITTTPSCVEAGESSFFLRSSDAVFDDATMGFTISGAVVHFADIFTNMDVDFGKIDYTVPDVQSDPDNTTSSNICGSPSSDQISGLPAVACGNDFDQTLNDRLGYYSSGGNDEQSVLAQAAPGSDSNSVSKRGYTTDLAIRSDLQKRGFFSFIKKAVAVVKTVANVVAKVAAPIIKAVAPIVQKIANLPIIGPIIKAGISVIKTAAKLAVFVVTGKYDTKLALPLKMGPPASSLTDSPWGKAIKFYSWQPEKGGELWNARKNYLEKIQNKLIGEPEPEPGVEFFCINCGIDGQITAFGSISATPLSGVKAATIGCNGNLYAGLYLGLNAFAKYEKKYEKELYKKGLPGWDIPGIVTLGPMLTLGVEAGISIEAEGQLLAGASLNWPKFEATLDFVDLKKSTQSGWVPQIDRKFEVAGTLGAETSLGLPISVEFGIDLLKGKFKRSVALTNTPAIAAHAELAASYNVDTGATLGNEECPGISWDIKLKDEITLGFKKGEEEGPSFTLKEWESGALAEGCVKLGSGGGSGDNTGSSSGGSDAPASSDPSSVTSSATTMTSSISPTSTSADSNTDSAITTPSGTSSSIPSPSATDTTKCNYWKGKQWSDSRGNAWDITCDRSAYDFPETFIGSVSQKESMLACFETCHFDNGRCERAFWQESGKQCYVVNVLIASDGGQRYHDGNAPWDYSQSFDAVAFPVSPFKIHDIVFDIFGVGAQVAPWWNRGHWIEINTNNFYQKFGDSQPGLRKEVHMMFQSGFEQRVMTFWEGQYFVHPGPIQNPDYVERIVPDPEPLRLANIDQAGSYVRIWDVGFGIKNIPTSSLPNIFNFAYNMIQNSDGWFVEYNCFDFIENRPNTKKTGVWFVEFLLTDPGAIHAVYGDYGDWISPSMFRRPFKMMKRDEEDPDSNDGNGKVGLANPDSELDPDTTSDDADTTSTSGADTSSTSSTDTTTTSSATNTTASSSADPSPHKMTISDASSQIFLNPGKDGNLWLSSSDTASTDVTAYSNGASFMGTNGEHKMVIGDTNANFLHWFPDEMSATGASRLRLATWDKLPVGSKLISLVELSDDSSSILAGIDSEGNYAYLYFCAIEGQLNKVFLAQDPTEADTSLQQDFMKFVVTGGQASDCRPVALRANLGDLITDTA